MRRLESWRRWGISAGVVLVFSLLVSSWVCVLPFQWDDYGEIAKASSRLDDLAQRAGWGGTRLEDWRSGILFRPAVWALWSAELGVSGEAANPIVFHVVSLVLHGLVALTLACLLARIVDRRAAFAAACWFALHPGAHQAVTWVSARGDLVVALGGALGAWLALGAAGVDLRGRAGGDTRGRPANGASLRGLLPLFACGCCLALAVCGKASGIAVGALVILLFALFSSGRMANRAKRLALLVAPLACVLVMRAWATGGLVPAHQMSDSFPGLAEVSRRLLPNLIALLAPIARPWGIPKYAFQVVAVFPLAILFLFALRKRPAATLMTGLVIGPLLAQSSIMGSGLDQDRHLYPVKVAVAVLVGLGVHALYGRGGPATRRRALLFLVFAVAGGLHFDRARREARHGLRHARAIETLRLLSRGDDPVAAAVWMPLNNVHPLNQLSRRAFRPPFQAEPGRVSIESSMAGALRNDLVRLYRGPVARFLYGRSGLRRLGANLPALSTGRARLEPDSPGSDEAAAWLVLPPVVSRGLHAIHFDDALLEGRKLRVDTIDGPLIRELEADEAGVSVTLAGDVEVMNRGHIGRLAVLSGDRGAPESWQPPVLTRTRRLTTLRALSPTGNASVDASEAPRFALTGVPAEALIRLHLQVSCEGRWYERRRDLAETDIARDAGHRISAHLPRESGLPMPSWHALFEELEEQGGVSAGFVPVRWRALAVSARGAILAQTRYNQFRIRRERAPRAPRGFRRGSRSPRRR